MQSLVKERLFKFRVRGHGFLRGVDRMLESMSKNNEFSVFISDARKRQLILSILIAKNQLQAD